MKTIIRQTTFLVMVLLAAVCHGANTNRYDYSRFKYLTASDIIRLESYRETLRKGGNLTPDKIERIVWNAAKVANNENWRINSMKTTKCIKDIKVVELPKSK